MIPLLQRLKHPYNYHCDIGVSHFSHGHDSHQFSQHFVQIVFIRGSGSYKPLETCVQEKMSQTSVYCNTVNNNSSEQDAFFKFQVGKKKVLTIIIQN